MTSVCPYCGAGCKLNWLSTNNKIIRGPGATAILCSLLTGLLLMKKSRACAPTAGRVANLTGCRQTIKSFA
ncbi:hypothetical protein CJ307_35045, partial [Klebsiella quasipneumoniae]